LGGASRQMEEKGYAIKEGSIQDATFITSDPEKRGKRRIKRVNAIGRSKILRPSSRTRLKSLIKACLIFQLILLIARPTNKI
jgi:hypothetical protein